MKDLTKLSNKELAATRGNSMTRHGQKIRDFNITTETCLLLSYLEKRKLSPQQAYAVMEFAATSLIKGASSVISNRASGVPQ